MCEVPCSRLLLHLASPVFADLLREFPSDGVLPVANPRFAAGAIRDALALMHPRARAPEDPRRCLEILEALEWLQANTSYSPRSKG